MVVAGAEESSGGRTVVVGVKLDSYSRELLTWALVKVAQAGDRVIALHVLKNNEIVDRDGKSSLLSLVKAFDSILEVYEGFCNLKQVDLKLKICRGSSIQKILVREAKSYYASEVIVGTAQTHHTIRSSASVAKYCAKKLSKDCSVLAVNNGKIVFHRDANLASRISVKELENNRRNGLLNALQRSFSKNIKVLNDGSPIRPMLTWDDGSSCGKSNLASASPEKCSICSPDSVAWHKSCRQSDEEPPADDGKKNSMAIVPVKKLEIASSSVSLLLRELPELKPGWPLLRRAIMSNRSSSYNSQVRQISVVQWAMRLPSRYCLFIEHSTRKDSDPNHDQDHSSKLDGETGAIVPVGNETVSVPSCPDRVPRSLPEELEGLHEKYSATCRLFMEMVIDACAKGNLGRFINHSCDPNCRTEKWMVNGEVCIGLFSLRDIKKGEEVTFDYNFVRVFGAAAKKCVCGSANSRGYIGGDLTNSEVIAQDDSDDEYKEPVMTCEDGEMSEDWNDIMLNYAHDREDEIANKPSQNIYSMKNFIGTVGESITTSHTTEPSPKKVEGVNSGHAAEIRVGDGVGVYDSIDNSSTADVVEKLNNKTTGESLKGSTPVGLTIECEGLQSQIHESSQVVDNNLQSDGIVNKTMSSAHESAISASRRKSLSGKVQFKRNLKYATVEVRDGLAKSNSLTKTNRSLSSIKKGKPKLNALKDRVSPDVDKLSAELHKSKKLPKLPINHHFEAVEEKLNELLDPEGGISKRKDASKGYLKLLFLTAATGNNGHGEAIQSNRDLSMILDALLKTKPRTVLVDIINKNGLQMLHNIMKRYRKEFTKTPILRKLLKVLEYFEGMNL